MSSQWPPSPTKRYNANPHHPSGPISSRNRRRWIIGGLSLLFLYLWHASGRNLLPQKHHVHDLSLNYKHIDWSRYAYSQYATDTAYLCNAVMVFEALERLGSKADRILFYPQTWDTEIASTSDRDSQLLVKAREWYKVKLMPVDMAAGGDKKGAWHGSFAKFFAWKQTQYDRVLHLDSDVTVLKHLDELFLLPQTPVAMMRAYWTLPEVRQLTSLIVLLQPSESAYDLLVSASKPENRALGDFDMEILNRLYGDSAMVLPHTQYGLLTGEFRKTDHKNFLGVASESGWDAEVVYSEAHVIHFSDWPLPKPWIMWPHELIGDIIPKCRSDRGLEVAHCKEKELWLGLYDDFRRRRKDICALLSAPAPNWPPPGWTGLGAGGAKVNTTDTENVEEA